eukprot:3694432-Pyramimonas_sp.AAC.1
MTQGGLTVRYRKVTRDTVGTPKGDTEGGGSMTLPGLAPTPGRISGPSSKSSERAGGSGEKEAAQRQGRATSLS